MWKRTTAASAARLKGTSNLCGTMLWYGTSFSDFAIAAAQAEPVAHMGS